jgi:hypothetical protein
MNKTLLPIRIVFVLLCTAAGWLVCYTVREWDAYRIDRLVGRILHRRPCRPGGRDAEGILAPGTLRAHVRDRSRIDHSQFGGDLAPLR